MLQINFIFNSINSIKKGGNLFSSFELHTVFSLFFSVVYCTILYRHFLLLWLNLHSIIFLLLFCLGFIAHILNRVCHINCCLLEIKILFSSTTRAYKLFIDRMCRKNEKSICKYFIQRMQQTRE